MVLADFVARMEKSDPVGHGKAQLLVDTNVMIEIYGVYDLLKVGDTFATTDLHLVKAIQGERFQIGNNRGGINSWITRRQIFGRLIAVEA